jgi:hypothetical protein
MIPRRLGWTTCAFMGALLALAPASAEAKERSDVKVDFVNIASQSDEDADGAGSLRLRLQERRAQLQLRFKRLTPNAWYAVVIDAADETCVQAGGNGSVNLRLVQTAESPDPEFFDPRGEDVFVLRDDAQDCGSEPESRTEVLCASLDPEKGKRNECKGPRMKVQEQTALEPTDAADGGSAELRFRLLPNGKRRFSVRIKHVPPGDYDVYVGDEGEPRQELITTNSGGAGRLDFTDNPPKGGGGGRGRNQKVPFDETPDEAFDPYDQDVEICSADVSSAEPIECSYDAATERVFYGPLFAQIPGVNVCEPMTEAEADLTDPEGAETPTGSASLSVDEDCEREFEVLVLEGLPEDTYPVFLDDGAEMEIGPIEVSADGTGELRFSSDPEESELLLDVDPIGKDVLVKNPNGITVLSGTVSVEP